ncbi:hypothetical protein Q757_04960 [Oenococcus alcoholitolerans]|uniref:Uncharacterized protein n=1 Tax=Oenococcus alcoholitolerans TaxID=931074 RepID=A0ABR4XQR2_9LACO|nr:hypothetical protein Q757_04960 [Oenococcus alcoholitolerans]
MGAGNAEGGMDAGNILKPALARGEFQLIGATTLKNIAVLKRWCDRSPFPRSHG